MYTQSGRSMVEMLGVLAIIGVLSVGAISGYSKAMFKYKLNKHAEQMTTVINAVARNIHSFDNIKGSSVLTPYLIKMGEIPTEMLKSNNSDYVYDIFGQQWQILNEGNEYVSGYDFGTYIPHIIYLVSQVESGSSFLFSNSSDSLAICRNILTAAKENSDSIYEIMIGTGNHGVEIFGDNTCNDTVRCLKDLTLDDIYTFCTEHKSGGMVTFAFIWLPK